MVGLVEGCSINDLGFVRVRHFENDSVRAVQLDAWGIQLLTGGEDAGVTLGFSQNTYFYPRGENIAARLPLSVLASQSDTLALHPVSCPCGSVHAEKLLARMVKLAGVHLDANGTRFGLSLGLRSNAALRIPLDEPLVLFIKSNPDHPETAEIYTSEEVP